MTHAELILNHLKQYGSITTMEAVREYQCFRLSARIYDLKASGHHITTEIVTRNGKQYANYKLHTDTKGPESHAVEFSGAGQGNPCRFGCY